MDINKSQAFFQEMSSAIDVMMNEARLADVERRRNKKLQDKIDQLKQELHSMKDFERKLRVMEGSSTVKICSACDGQGGFVEGDPLAGFSEFQCDTCHGNRVIPK